MTHLCPDCSEIVEDCGGSLRNPDEIVYVFLCEECGCGFSTTFSDPETTVETHGESWDGKEN